MRRSLVAAVRRMRKLGACAEAREWAVTQASPQAAWDACSNPLWMLWLLGRLAGPVGSDSRKALVMIAVECAETALPFIKDGETEAIARHAIQAAVRYIEGDCTIEELRDARYAAYAAYAAADAADAAYAAAAAADAAYAAYAAAAADAAYAAAAYAADAAADDAADAARSAAQKRMCEIIRRYVPVCPIGGGR